MSGATMVGAFLAGLVLIFALAIAWGLRSRAAHFADAARTVNAEMLWTRFGAPGWDREALLYGVPTDFSMTDVGWIVKDAHDREVGRIHGGVGGYALEIGGDRYRITWRRSLRYGAELRRAPDGGGDPASVLCALELAGPITARVARFTPSGGAPLEVARPLGWPKERRGIVRDGAGIGALCVLNVNRPMARTVLVPGTVPVAVRMFLLALG